MLRKTRRSVACILLTAVTFTAVAYIAFYDRRPALNPNYDIIPALDDNQRRRAVVPHRRDLKESYGEPVLRRPLAELHGLGAGGEAVDIDRVTREEEMEVDAMKRTIKEYSINQYISEKISLHRDIDDHRHPMCRVRAGFNYLNLPTASVVIAFYNEAKTTLLRTIYSVLHTSPASLLAEIILIDDFSDKRHLKDDLEDALRDIPRIRLIRTKQREGLVRARLLGASKAKGEVVVFLDCHCECMTGWLEPLLERIEENSKVIAIPVIDTIDWNTFRYYYGGHEPQIGGFDWRLTFQWHAIPAHEKRRRETSMSPIRSPTMAGGLFAIKLDYFIQLGTYDGGMEIWGGENLELSFRTWMCGGILETIPCSHVGHVFPRESPYPRPKFLKNTVRAVEVWLDDYKRHFYIRNPTALKEQYGDISDRVKLRKELKCNSFGWYLDNIYPDLHIPQDREGHYGALRNKGESQYCLDYALPSTNPLSGQLSVYPCHGQGGNQFFEHSSSGELRFNSEREMCVMTSQGGDVLTMMNCALDGVAPQSNQIWKYTDDLRFESAANGKCLEAKIEENGSKMSLLAMTCDTSEKRQKWTWYTSS